MAVATLFETASDDFCGNESPDIVGMISVGAIGVKRIFVTGYTPGNNIVNIIYAMYYVISSGISLPETDTGSFREALPRELGCVIVVIDFRVKA